MFGTKKIFDRISKVESTAGRIILFWSTVTAFVALIPTIAYAIYRAYLTVMVLANVLTYVDEFRNATEYHHFMDMQLQSIVREEMDADTVYKVVLQKTNYGDVYYFDTVIVNGVVRPIVYSANVKRKANKDGLHVYVQDINGNHKWVKPKRQHRHD